LIHFYKRKNVNFLLEKSLKSSPLQAEQENK